MKNRLATFALAWLRTTARGQGGVVARWYMLEKSKQLTRDAVDVFGAGYNTAAELLRGRLE